MKFIDLCSGIGGFRVAFESVGFQCVYSSEKDKHCRETYYNNFGHYPQSDDITTLNPLDIPDYDILLAGFPCQAFSISGKQQGFNDIRGTIFFYITNIIKQTQPKIILLENVKHLIHHNKGNTFQTILITLKELGYEVEFKVINATQIGVPQNRERIYICATKSAAQSSKIITINDIKTPSLNSYLNNIDNISNFKYLNTFEYELITHPKKQKSGLIFKGFKIGKLRNCKIKNKNLSRVHKQPNRIYDDYGVAPTIMAQEISGRYYIYDNTLNLVRKLTLRECYALMGFQQNFKIHKTQSQAFKQIGNSVVIPILTQFAKNIKNLCYNLTT